ncbi:helix-turn-helix domain-containing protein [Diaphorobacter sp. LI3]|uniref:helix-turn-helix domain-containing protein n=1 Tax=Diaphorobacter sp. LI3 TaxID=2952886 RepID=UPI0039834853
MHARSIKARVTVRASRRPARRPCVLYSVTGSITPAPTKLHGPVWPPQRRSDSTALVWFKDTSERTLARRMQALGLSYTAVLDAARHQAALHALAQADRPLGEISQSLGFAEPSVFNRAFRRWTGCTPGQWRQAARPPGEPSA